MNGPSTDLIKSGPARKALSIFSRVLKKSLEFQENYEECGLKPQSNNLIFLNKGLISSRLRIQLHFLNIILRYLKIYQCSEQDSDGWSAWLLEDAHNHINTQESSVVDKIKRLIYSIKISHITQREQLLFEKSSICEWINLTGNDNTLCTSKENLFYLISKDPALNAFLCHLFPEDGEIYFIDYYIFSCHFSPIESSANKIQSFFYFLEQFHLSFSSTCENCHIVYDKSDPNCFLIGKERRIWNLPNVIYGEQYLIDSFGNTYSSWSDILI